MTRLDDLRRAIVRPPIGAIAPGARRAAVAAIAVPGPSDADLLFIVRSTHPGDPWSGQIAFPGGRLEANDPDARHAAIRETREELGLDLGGAHHLGALDDLAPLSGLHNLVVHPFLFWLDEIPPLAPNEAEVAGVLRAPLGQLLEGRRRGVFDLEWKGERRRLPHVDLEGPTGQDVRLWGMTLRIVDDLLDRIDGRGIGLERPSHPG